MAFDVARQKCVLFGGYDCTGGPCTTVPGTWEWDGVDWSLRSPTTTPGDRFGPAMAYDPRRGRVLLFGGTDCFPAPFCLVYADTWYYGAIIEVIGPGHQGGGLPLVMSGTPQLGGSFCVGFTNPSSPAGHNLLLLAPGAGLRQPITLDPPGVCYRAFVHVAPQAILWSTGNPASFCFAVPAVPALAGASATVQGASLEIGVCFRVSDGLLVVLQP